MAALDGHELYGKGETLAGVFILVYCYELHYLAGLEVLVFLFIVIVMILCVP